jgi:hypothetical protein
MVNKNRAQAVRDLITQYQPDIIISDDGLQHYAMGRAVIKKALRVPNTCDSVTDCLFKKIKWLNYTCR